MKSRDSSKPLVAVEFRGPVAIVTFDRPDVQNALNAQMRIELLEAIRTVDATQAIRVAILTARGRNFSAGADLNAQHPAGHSIERMINEEYKPILGGITQSPKPWICAVNGGAAGIGSAIVMACDLIVMAKGAYLHLAFATIGLIPDGGISWHLVRTVGYARAFELIVRGERLSAERCVALGLCNRIAPKEGLLDHAFAWASELAEAAPLALRHSKDSLNRAMQLTFEETISYEAALQQHCVASEDFREGSLAFKEKRRAHFTGR